jgi:hypothetical protein
MFYRADINTPFVNVDISSATNANGLFWYRTVDQPITNLNLSSVTSVDNMFTRSTISAVLSNWNISSLTDGTEMFASWDYDNFGSIINSSLLGIDFSGLTNMTSMFRKSTMDQDISGWNSFISNVTICSWFDSGTPATWISSEKPTFTSCSI